MLSSIMSIYDDNTAQEVANVTVSQELDNDHLSLEKHGAIWIDTPVEAVNFTTDGGLLMSIDGHINKIEIDINNKKFIKLATTIDEPNDNPLEQIVEIYIVLPPEGNDNDTTDDKNDSNSGNSSSGTIDKPSDNTGSTDKPNNDKNPEDEKNNPNEGESNDEEKTDSSIADNDSSSNSENITIDNGNSSYNSENKNSDTELVENPKTGIYTSFAGVVLMLASIIGLKLLQNKKVNKKL